MNHILYTWIFVLVFAFASGTPSALREDVSLPKFSKAVCGDDDFTLCLNVEFSDNTTDLIIVTALPDASTIFKGRTNENKKVVVILKDAFNPEDTIVFKSDKAGDCTRFSVDLDGSGETTCLNEKVMTDDEENEDEGAHVGSRETKEDDRSLEEIQLSPRALDPNGYKINVAVYYDDMFKEQFGNAATTRVQAVMAIVDEMYSEKDTLKTEIDVNVVAVEHQSGSNWGSLQAKPWYSKLSPWAWNPVAGGDLSQIATDSQHEANLYVFLTGSESLSGLGLANLDSVCDLDRRRRININKYAAGSRKGGDAYTAETVAHEMGHNLGMDHDCINFNCAYWEKSYRGPRTLNGVECFGYMDYKDKTNYWSPCSVADFTLYINKQANGFCLEPIDATATCSDGRKNQDETGVDCGGATCNACGYVLLQSGAECNSADQHLGDFSSVDGCANACSSTMGCEIFMWYQVSDSKGRCYWEQTSDASCPEGWSDDDDFDVYQIGNEITESECLDVWKEKKCKRIAKKGRCGKKKAAKNCQKTCNKCG